MPKAKSALTEPDNNSNAMELDPLIDALLEHLPAPGEHWPKEHRDLWLEILTLVFKLIYEDHPPETNPDEPTTP